MSEKSKINRLIYIDANVYLRFYDNNARSFKNLLSSVLEVKDSIFVTSQIADEVQRNKLSIFIATYKEYLNQFKFVKTILPEHLSPSSDKILAAWNKETERLEAEVSEQRKKLENIVENIIASIAKSLDEVSILLRHIFSTSMPPSVSEFKRARERKEFGNPPGKPGDPLGDQISWEQLLNQLDGIDELYIITNDYDYLSIFNKRCFLNPFLFSEITDRNKEVNVLCFNTLSEALGELNASKKIDSLPEPNKLDAITKEEKTLASSLINVYNLDRIIAPQSPLALSGSTHDYLIAETTAELRAIFE